MSDSSLTLPHSTFILTKSKGLTRANCAEWRERATKFSVPLNMEMALVNQRTIGVMELVPSAVRPNPIEQRCRSVKVRTLQKVWMSSRFQLAETAARNPFLVLWGLEIPKRTRPEGPLWSRPEGQKSDGSARSIIRKRQRASRTEGADPFIRKRPRATCPASPAAHKFRANFWKNPLDKQPCLLYNYSRLSVRVFSHAETEL